MLPKPEPRRKSKARAMRLERTIVQSVRKICAERDGYCRVARDIQPTFANYPQGLCAGDSEWAHMHDYRRSKTVGKPPEERHTTGGSLMLCSKHHRQYDDKDGRAELIISGNADGDLVFYWQKK